MNTVNKKSDLEKRASIDARKMLLWLTHQKSPGESESEADIGCMGCVFDDSIGKKGRMNKKTENTIEMKKFKSSCKIVLALLLLLIGSVEVIAQTSTTPTQSVCPGTEPYKVIPGNATDLLQWSVLGGVSGTDWTISSPNTAITDIIWVTPGTYTVTFRETDTSTSTNCFDEKVLIVTVNPLPVATIAYAGSPYCAVGTAAVTQTGQAGGTYASTAGMIINSTSGTIDLVASAPGTYTVTYTFSNGTCTNTTEASVTINTLPVATITYAGSPFCAVGSAAVTQTGQTGGTYASTAGLVVNASTGAIDLVTSTAGTYTVTYTFSNGTCTNTTEASVTINALPAATITYAGSPYCAVGTATVTQTGQAGGTYASTAGLVVDANTGAIDLVASTAGTYTVTYTFSNGTCTNTTEASITINPLPVVALGGPSPICEKSAGNIYTTDPGMSNYVWIVSSGGNISAGGSATDPNVTVTWNTAGAQTVSVTYTNANGCTATKVIPITVNPLPNTSPIYHK